MRRAMICGLLFVLACLIAGCHDSSSVSHEEGEGQKHVLIIHPYTRGGAEGREAVRLYEQAFAHRGVRLTHLFSGVPEVDYWQSVLQFATRFQHWQETDSMPDLVILHGDEAIDRYFAGLLSEIWTADRQPWMEVPVVFTGVVCLDTVPQARAFPDIRMTGFHNKIEWEANLQLSHRLWPGTPVVMDMDYYLRDIIYREDFLKAVRSNPMYVDNSDFHLPLQGVDTVAHPEYRNKLIVDIVSFREKHTNLPGATLADTLLSPERKHALDSMMYVMLHNAKYTRPMQTKLDIHSNRLIDHAQMPQLTCVNAQFLDTKNNRILGGYFVDLPTQVNDAMSYALQVLDGTDPRSLPEQTSRAQLHLSWKAMEAWGMKYGDWKGEADIVGAPLKVRRPLLWLAAWVMGFLLVMMVASALFYLLHYLLHNTSMVRTLRAQQEQMEWILKGNNCAIWRITPTKVFYEGGGCTFRGGISESDHDEFVAFFHPDDRDIIRHMLTLQEEEKHHSHRVRIQSKDGHYQWTELVYDVTTKTLRDHELQVMVVDIDNQKRDEDDVLYSLQKSEETNLKQSFLANLTHDLRSPLASIVSMADIIADEDADMTDDERRQFADLIEQNSNVLLKLMDDVSTTSRLQMGEYRFMRKNVLVGQMMRSIYQMFQVLVPEHLTFSLEEGDDCVVNVDQARVTQVLNNFLSNAVKATAEGSITMGWRVLGDEVELYVRDTGCGIPKETIGRLFDKFFKADGRIEGAGLGLSICQTMVKKQEGRIEVESQVGKGSTFSALFRRVSLVVACCMALFATSCKQQPLQTKPTGEPFQVTVLHSFDEQQVAYQELDEALATRFRRAGLSVQLSHLYLDNDDHRFHPDADRMTHELLHTSGVDLVLCEGTPALNRLMEQASLGVPDSVELITLPFPVVAGNITSPFWDAIKRFSNLRVWTSGVDPRTILPFIVQVTGQNMVEVELDYDDYNNAVRNELHGFLKGIPYMDQLDMNDMRVLRPECQATLFADSIIVLGISVVNSDMNGINDPAQLENEFRGQYEELTDLLLSYSVNYPQLVVKKDLWGRELASRTHRPQFTLTPYDFGMASTPYLAGYFPSMNTVAADLVSTATKLLLQDASGTTLCGRHQREKYIDYNALEAYGIDYKDVEELWVVVNVPFRLRNPYAFYGIPLLLIFVTSYLLVRRYYSRHYQKVMQFQRGVSEGRISLLGAESYVVHADQSGQIRLDGQSGKQQQHLVSSLHSMVQPEYADLVDVFFLHLRKPGNYNLELPLTFNDGKNYHWWRMTYQVTPSPTGKGNVARGVLINIDTRVERNRKMKQTRDHIREMERKEKFLNNLNHEIRTPLNIILGFSEILASPSISVTKEERASFTKKIRSNSKRLLSEVQDILDYSRLESGRMKYDIQPHDVDTLMLPLMEEQKYKVEHPAQDADEAGRAGGELAVHILPGRSGLVVMADATCVRRIYEQLIANAVKFTPKGEIVTGWQFDIQKGMVEVYVEDTGIGMNKKTIGSIFQDFFKFDKMGVGIGLGLPICRAMVVGMGGHMEVNSALGRGTRISFFLQLAPEEEG